VLLRWLPETQEWVPAESSLVAIDANVVSGTIPSGGVYCVFALETSADSIAPGRVSDLGATTALSDGAIDLEWTATGDDSTWGTATQYILAFSDSMITDSTWAGASKIAGAGTPVAAGGRELHTVTLPLPQHVYYLALRVKDEAGNVGPLSNIASVVTGQSDSNFFPGPPGNLRAIDAPGDSGTAIVLSWVKSDDDGGGKGTVKRYKIYRGPTGVSAPSLIDSVQAGMCWYLDTLGVVVGGRYTYRVSAADSILQTSSLENSARSAINIGVPVCDFTSDGSVGVDDFSDFVDNYGVDSTYAEFEPLYDVNRDGEIYVADSDSVEARFGEGGLPLPDSVASNAGTNVMYRWVHVEANTWHLNIVCTNAASLAGYSFRVSYDAGSMTLGAVTADSVGMGNNLLNKRGGLTPLFLVREDSSSVTIANVITGASNYTSANGSGFLANLVFTCSAPGPTSVDDVVLMDSEKRLNLMGTAVAVPTAPPVPARYALYQNYPNPFNPVTTIRFELPVASKAVLRVFDVSGRVVKTLVERPMDAGQHTVVWNGRSDAERTVASGVYFYRLHAGSFVATRKMVLLR